MGTARTEAQTDFRLRSRLFDARRRVGLVIRFLLIKTLDVTWRVKTIGSWDAKIIIAKETPAGSGWSTTNSIEISYRAELRTWKQTKNNSTQVSVHAASATNPSRLKKVLRSSRCKQLLRLSSIITTCKLPPTPMPRSQYMYHYPSDDGWYWWPVLP